MKLITALKDGDYIIRISGDIDHHATVGLREEIDGVLERENPRRLVMDLGSTDFCDSSGLGLILGRYRKTVEKNMEFLLVNPTPEIMKILRLAGVDKMLDIRNI